MSCCDSRCCDILCDYECCDCRLRPDCCNPPSVVKIYPKANPLYALAIRPEVGTGVCLVSGDKKDSSQLWLLDRKLAYRHGVSRHGLSILHKNSGLALCPGEQSKQLLLKTYQPEKMKKKLVWILGKDLGGGYRTVTPWNGEPQDWKIKAPPIEEDVERRVVMHAMRCMKCDSLEQKGVDDEHRMKENTLVITFKDSASEGATTKLSLNQLWKMEPVRHCC